MKNDVNMNIWNFNYNFLFGFGVSFTFSLQFLLVISISRFYLSSIIDNNEENSRLNLDMLIKRKILNRYER